MDFDGWVGSPSAKLRIPPHVVFLIDLSFLKHPFHNPSTPEVAFNRLVIILEKVLVYFHQYVDSRFRWGVQCFDALDSPDISVISRGRFHELNGLNFKSVLEQLQVEFNKIVNAKELKRSKPILENISVRLAQVLSDFAWHENPLLNVPRLEPERRENEPIPVKNYLYVLSLLPQDYLEMLCWLDGKMFDTWNDQIRYYITGRKPDFDTLSNRIQSHLITRGLCEGYSKSGISLNWINIRNLVSSDTELDVFGDLVKTYLGNALEAFGGAIIPLEPFLTTSTHVPFSALFKHYRKKFIDPAIGPRLLESNCLVAKLRHIDSSHSITLASSTGCQCSLIITTLNNDAQTLKFKSPTNLEAVQRKLTFKTGEILYKFRSHGLPFDWILRSIDQKFLCHPNHATLEETANLTELLQSLLKHQQALILKLELLVDLSSETTMEASETSTETRYGILEAVSETSGILTLLKPGVEEQHMIALGHPMLKGDVERKQENRETFVTSFSPFYLENWWTDTKLRDIIDDADDEQGNISVDCEAPIIPETQVREISPIPKPVISESKDEDKENVPPTNGNGNGDQSYAEDVRGYIQNDYFNALYDNKVQLYEFVEAAMKNHLLVEPSRMFEYLEFLCSDLILDLGTLEEKYKSNIPCLINNPESSEPTLLSDNELNYFKAWARNKNEPDFKHNHIHELKIREIYLQIILLLEFMRIRRAFKDHVKASHSIPMNVDETRILSKSEVLRRLDTFWDRLFIWISIGSGGLFSVEEKEDPGYDAMRRFYNHVCYKYYRSSIPEIIKVIVKKIKSDMMPSTPTLPKPEPKLRRRTRVMKDKIPTESPSPRKGNRRTIMEINSKRNEIIFNNPLFKNREVAIQNQIKYDENKAPENGQSSKRKRKPFSPDNLINAKTARRTMKSPLLEYSQYSTSIDSPISTPDQHLRQLDRSKLIVAQSPESSPLPIESEDVNFIPRTPERVVSDNEDIFVAESPT
ncbi:hypothetical protein K7432_000250 [Basidiobolus ranarum]|uniref:DNA replication regulator Sld3 C-terminal domain-containing protein n=1 Tax=Basidiobolus ranarum TaxID=34480 RepID=A0ABR2X506_9FUNG